jgi:hypothetical protein
MPDRVPDMDLDIAYRAWLAAVARGHFEQARVHAANLLHGMREFPQHQPAWSEDARASFLAWCRGEAVLPELLGPDGLERRKRPRSND